MKRLALAAVLLMLTGCTTVATHVLGHECNASKVPQPVFKEHVMPIMARTDLGDAPCLGHVAGCAQYDDLVCEIWYTYGDTLTRCHEITHCIEGEFHP